MQLAHVALALAVVGAAAGGCGSGGGRGSLIHDVKFDVGGRVSLNRHDDVPLAGVTVTLIDDDGDTETATTGADGLWTATNLHPGPWIERFSLEGYETLERPLFLPVDGENDVENVFVASEEMELYETLLEATVSPFGVTVENGSFVRDGFDGAAFEYSVLGDGSITVRFDRDVIDADGSLEDGVTGQNVNPSFDDVTDTLTFSADDIDTMNGGGTPLSTDSDPWTFHTLTLYAFAKTPIHADAEELLIIIFFNAVP